MIAGTHSGVGKTTIATGIMAALSAKGLKVAAAKAGPDFIDPTYHRLATGRPGTNLDPWLSSPSVMPALAARAAAGAEILVVEGVMGLYDGSRASPEEYRDSQSSMERAREHPTNHLPFASSAHLASLLGCPVILVVDASAMSGSVAAMVHGYSTWARECDVAGIILNRVAGPSHEELLREALGPLRLPVLGTLPRDNRLRWRERHLGLVPVIESQASVRQALELLSSAVSQHVDLEGVVRIASRATGTLNGPERAPTTYQDEVHVALASGPAFSFAYHDNLERLEEAGAVLCPFDPMRHKALPAETDAMYAGGGFPEVYAADLSANTPLLDDIRERAKAGLPIWAECGGLLWLSRSIQGKAMCGVLPASSVMTDRLTLGYRLARTTVATPLGPPGTELPGHEFHYSRLSPSGEALELRERYTSRYEGYGSPSLLATYLHVHMGTLPHIAESFVASAARASLKLRATTPPITSDREPSTSTRYG